MTKRATAGKSAARSGVPQASSDGPVMSEPYVDIITHLLRAATDTSDDDAGFRRSTDGYYRHINIGDDLFEIAIRKVPADRADRPRQREMSGLEARPRERAPVVGDGQEETRSRLLTATIQLLKEHGFSGFRIADVSVLAGVSRGAQTHHFATRDKLIEAAIADLFERAVEQAQRERENMPEGDLLAKTRDQIIEFMHGDLYRVSLHLIIAAGSAEHFADGVRAISARSRGALDQLWIDRFVALGASMPVAEECFGVLSNSCRGMTIQEWIRDEPVDTDAVKDLTLELIRRKLAEDIDKA